MRVQKTKKKYSSFVRIIALLCAVLICVTLVPVNSWAVGDVEKEQAVDTLDNSNTDDGTETTPGTDDGTGTTPGTDDGTETTPGTDDGTGTTPGTDNGTGTTPDTDDGTETTPGTDDGTGTTPDTDDGTGTTPGTDDGTETTPGTDDGTGTTPDTDDGTETTPGTDDGTETTPGTDDGTGTTPGTDDGTGTTPDTDDGTGTTPGTDDGTGTTPGTDDGDTEKDTEAPKVTDENQEEGKYITVGGKTWVIKDEDLTFSVSDKEPSSGVESVEVQIKGSKAGQKINVTNSSNDTDIVVSTSDVQIPYKNLFEGENTITVTATDNAGNELAQPYEVTVYKDAEEPQVTDKNQEENKYVIVEDKTWVIKDEDLTFSVSDKEPSSGVESVEVQIKGSKAGQKINVTNSSNDTDIVVSTSEVQIPYGNLFEGQNTITITVKDQAGNINKQDNRSYTVYVDAKAPVITGATVTVKDENKLVAWIEKVLFGIKDKEKEAIITVEVSDAVPSSGIQEVSVQIGETTLKPSKELEVKQGESGDATVVTTATFQYPVDELSPNEDIQVSFAAKDNVGLVSAEIQGTGENLEQAIKSMIFLYDNQRPQVSNDVEKKSVKVETEEGPTYWVNDADNFITFTVTDPQQEGETAIDYAGLASATVTVTHSQETEGTEVARWETDQKEVTQTVELVVTYDKLAPGENTITVAAADNAGNELAQPYEVTVYKDDCSPVVTDTTAQYFKDKKDENKKWIKKDQPVTFDVSDADPTSGVEFVEVQIKGSEAGQEVNVTNSSNDTDIVVSTSDVQIPYGDLFEGKNMITITATDKVGNKTIENFELYKDATVPIIESIKVETETGFLEWIGKYLFGINDLKDGKEKYRFIISYLDNNSSSGIKELQILRTVTVNGEEQTAKVENATVTYDRENKSCTVTIDKQLISANRDTKFSFVVVDNVGNSSETKPFARDEIDEAANGSIFLYDDQRPEVCDDVAKQSVKVETEEGPTYWVKANNSITFTVTDPIQSEKQTVVNYAGLAGSTLTVTGENQWKRELTWAVDENGDLQPSEEDLAQIVFTYGTGTVGDEGEKTIVQAAAMTVKYGDLAPGKNTITVTATDNAGNNSEPYSVTVYKDDKEPEVKDENKEGEKGEYVIIGEKTWVKKDKNLTFSVSDEEPTSGVEFVEVQIQGSEAGQEVNVTNSSNDTDIVVSVSKVQIPYKNLFEGQNTITITVTDRVGNVNEQGNQRYTVYKDTVPPTGTIDMPDANYTEGDKSWYNSTTLAEGQVEFIPKDVDSGVQSYLIKMNDGQVYEGKDNTLTTTLAQLGNLNEGTNMVELLVCDNVGNWNCIHQDNEIQGQAITETFYVDTISPYVQRFDFQPEGNEYGNGDPVKTGTYGYFFSRTTNVTVTVDDGDITSGIGTIYFLTKDVNGTIKTSSKTITGSGTTATFTVAAGFKGEIYASVADRVGNTPSEGSLNRGELNYVRPENTVIETPDEHNHYSSIEIALPGTNHQDSKNQNLYSGDVTVPITVTDTRSGIQHVTVTVTAAYGENRESSYELDIGHDGAVGNGWTKASGESNLVYEVTRNITVTNNSNDITIRVELTDQAGNTSEEEVMLGIDKSQPEITVVFENNDVLNERYFKADRSATITVRDANFNGADIVCSQTGAALNFGGGMGDWAQTGPDQNGIYTYTLTRTFAEDGDYLFNMSVTDRAGNQTNDNQVQYTGAAVHDFVVDKTMPELQMSLENAFSNGHYLKDDDRMVITITEHNFDTEGYAATARFVNVNDQTQAFLTNGTWSGNGDVYSAAFPVEEEGTYYVESVTFTDLAGNVVTVQGGELGYGLFELDKTAPAIQIRNGVDGEEINGTANKGDVNPVVVISDENFSSNDVSVTLTAYRQDANLETYTTQQPLVTQENGEGGYVAFTNFQEQEGADNIYTITVTASDLAGNPTPYTATFSVNRFGSTYMLSSATHETVEQHWINGAWLEEIENVEIVEINPDRLNSRQVTITRGNEILTLEEGVDYQVVEQVPAKQGDDDYQTASHWYEYTYLIPVSNFEQEGAYTIGLMSLDEAENQQTNEATRHATNLFSEMGNELVYDEFSATAKVTFVVDKTSPVNTITGLEERSYLENEHSFSVISQDETMLDRAEVYLDGELVQTVYEEELAETGYQFDYTLNSKNTHQTVQIVAYDKAGNQSDAQADQYRVLVTTNLWVQFVNSLPAIIIAVIVVALIVVCIIVLAKKKKKRGGKQAV